MIGTLLVLAKRPVAGRVKTRLVPPLTYDQAADLARAALDDTLRIASTAPASRRVLVLDGAEDRSLPPGWHCVKQVCGGLDERIAAAFEHAIRRPALLIGMDTPQLRHHHLASFDHVHYDACLGPAADGGFWAIGFTDPRHAAAAIRGVPMSTGATGREQLRRLRALGLRVQQLDPLEDVDTFDSAVRVAGDASDSAFARAVRALEPAARCEPVG